MSRDAAPSRATTVQASDWSTKAAPSQVTGAPRIIACPGPGEVVEVKAGRALSVGPGQAMILGAPVSCDGAAVADQSDAWTVVALDGAASRDVLARLTPLDLRDSALPEGRTARTLIGHMTGSLTRVGAFRYEIMVFRSMTQTLIQEITRAMTHVEARTKL